MVEVAVIGSSCRFFLNKAPGLDGQRVNANLLLEGRVISVRKMYDSELETQLEKMLRLFGSPWWVSGISFFFMVLRIYPSSNNICYIK